MFIRFMSLMTCFRVFAPDAFPKKWAKKNVPIAETQLMKLQQTWVFQQDEMRS
jgi:hypothetical protein